MIIIIAKKNTYHYHLCYQEEQEGNRGAIKPILIWKSQASLRDNFLRYRHEAICKSFRRTLPDFPSSLSTLLFSFIRSFVSISLFFPLSFVSFSFLFPFSSFYFSCIFRFYFLSVLSLFRLSYVYLSSLFRLSFLSISSFFRFYLLFIPSLFPSRFPLVSEMITKTPFLMRSLSAPPARNNDMLR